MWVGVCVCKGFHLPKRGWHILHISEDLRESTIWPLWTCANVFCLSKRSWYFHMSCANLRYHYNMNLMESTNINVLHNVQCTYPRDPDEDDPGWNGQKFSLAKSTWDVSPRWAMSQPGTCNFCQLLLFKVFSTQRSRSFTVFAWWTYHPTHTISHI